MQPPSPSRAPHAPPATPDHPHQMPPGAQELAIHDPLADSFPPGLQGRLLWGIAVAFSVFQIATGRISSTCRARSCGRCTWAS